MRELTQPLRDNNIVEPCSNIQFAANSVLPPKKDLEGNWTGHRLAHDWRQLNARTPQDPYRLPRIDDLFSNLGPSTVFTKIDLRSWFLQIPIKPEDRHKTAFWLDRQLYQYRFMPFGMKNAQAVFQRIVDLEVQKAGLAPFCVVYVDDLLIYSQSPSDHIAQVEKVLQMLHGCGLRAHPDKTIVASAVISTSATRSAAMASRLTRP